MKTIIDAINGDVLVLGYVDVWRGELQVIDTSQGSSILHDMDALLDVVEVIVFYLIQFID